MGRQRRRGDLRDRVRANSSGATHWLAEEAAADRNCRFSLGYAIDDRVRLAVETSMALDDTKSKRAKQWWTPALEADGEHRERAEVADLTDRTNLDTWPDGTRLILRRERAHPGAQLSLFDDIEGRRHTAFITNQEGDAPILELAHRQRGAAEDVIRDLKACGYNHFPSDDIVNNQACALCCAKAFNLLSRAQRLTLDGRYRTAAPKTIRHRLLHIAGRITPSGHRLHLDRDWP